MKYFSAAHFSLTKSCNLNCEYCYVHKNNDSIMKNEIAEKGIRFLVNGAIKNNQNYIDIGFFGGEPTLEIDLMEHILDYAYAYTEQIKITEGISIIPRFNLTTNGTIFNNRLEQFLNKWYHKQGTVFIQLSYDGIPSAQNIKRLTPDGKPTGTLMVETIDKYLNWAKKIGANPREIFGVHSVFTKETLPMLGDSAIYFFGKNLPYWYILLPEEKWDKTDAEIYDNELHKAVEYIKERDPSYFLSSKSYSAKAASNGTFCEPSCLAGINFCNIAFDGKIYACHRMAENDIDDYIGDLNKEGKVWIDIDKKEIFENIKADDFVGKIECKHCKNAPHCYRCMAANMNSNILPNLCFPQYCEMVNIETPILSDIRSFLSKKNLISDSTPANAINDEEKFLIVDNLTELNTNFNKLIDGIHETNILIGDGIDGLQKQIDALRSNQLDILNLVLNLNYRLLPQEKEE